MIHVLYYRTCSVQFSPMTNSITAQQQTAFESMVTEIAKVQNLPRPQAAEMLVNQLGGGAEKVSDNWQRRFN